MVLTKKTITVYFTYKYIDIFSLNAAVTTYHILSSIINISVDVGIVRHINKW